MTRRLAPILLAMLLALAVLPSSPASANVQFVQVPTSTTYGNYTRYNVPLGEYQRVTGPGMTPCDQWIKLGNFVVQNGGGTGFGQMKWRSGPCAVSGFLIQVYAPGVGIISIPGPATMCAVGPNVDSQCAQLSDSSLFMAPQLNPNWPIVQVQVWVCTQFAAPACYHHTLSPLSS